jgi:hypothetical protein
MYDTKTYQPSFPPVSVRKIPRKYQPIPNQNTESGCYSSHKGCGWLASRRGSKYIQKKHIVEKDVVGLLLEEVVSTKKHTSSQRMWLAYW